jgi:hypothetical protein
MHLWQTGREQQERWRAAMMGFSVLTSVVSSTEEQMQQADMMMMMMMAERDNIIEWDGKREWRMRDG